MNVAYNKTTIKICIDINIEISKVDHYTWIYTFRIFKLALEITFLPNKYLFLQMVYEFLNTVRTKLVEFSATAQRIRLE